MLNPPSPQRSSATIFVHIPKTGGTSFLNAFRRAMEPGSVVSYHDNESLARFEAAASPTDLPDAKLVAGHLPLPAFRAKGYTGWAIAVVRSPVDRMLSMYRYLLASTHPDHESLKFETAGLFLEYLRRTNWYMNVQCRMLSGEPSFQSAHQALLRERLIVVPLERIDPLAASLTEGWEEPLVVPRDNVTDPDSTVDDHPEFEMATDLYDQDLLLYHHMLEVAPDMLVRARAAVESGEIQLERRPVETVIVGEEQPENDQTSPSD